MSSSEEDDDYEYVSGGEGSCDGDSDHQGETKTTSLRQSTFQTLRQVSYDVIDEDNDYKYLRTMPIDSVEEENVAKLLSECGNKEVALEILKKKRIEEMWLEELTELSQQYNIYRNARIRRAAGVTTKKKKIKRVKKVILKKLT